MKRIYPVVLSAACGPLPLGYLVLWFLVNMYGLSISPPVALYSGCQVCVFCSSLSSAESPFWGRENRWFQKQALSLHGFHRVGCVDVVEMDYVLVDLRSVGFDVELEVLRVGTVVGITVSIGWRLSWLKFVDDISSV